MLAATIWSRSVGFERRIPTVLLAVMLGASACSTATTDTTEPPTPSTITTTQDTGTPDADTPAQPPSAVAYEPVDLAAAAAQLNDPETAVNGVMSILDTLGIGVYTTEGTEVLPGSQTGPDDLWVLAEMLPGLAVSASRQGPTLEQYLETLESTLATGLQPAEMAAVYAVMVEDVPDLGISRAIRALDIRFAPNERLTRFEAWLLLLPWLPANGAATPSAAPESPQAILAMTRPLAAPKIHCEPTKTGDKKPGYSLFDQFGKPITDEVEGKVIEKAIERLGDGWSAAGTAASNASKAMEWLKNAAKPLTTLLDIVKAAQVAANFDVAVDADPISTHEVHDTQGETKEKKRSQVTVTVTFLGASVTDKEDCKYVPLLGLPNPNTPIEGAQVEFKLDKDLADHGTVRRRDSQNKARASADANGQVVVWYEPDYENPDAAQKLSDAFEHKVQGTFTVSVNITAAMGQLFNPAAGWEFFADLLGLNEIQGWITGGWHDPAAKIAVTEPLKGWNGNQAIYLETCDGINWTGAVVGNGTLDVAGGKLTQVTDSDISVIMSKGASSGTSPVLIETDVTGTVEGGTMENRMTQTGELTLSIDENGNATLEMALDQGTQDITVKAGGFSTRRSDVINPETRTWTTAMQPQTCDS